MKESILKIENLSHRYSVQWAIRDINFEIDKNGIYGLLGSNGAGKSTTMNIICGVLKQTEGSVSIKGIDMRKDPVQAKRHIGFLPQIPPLHPDLTVEEYLVHCANLRYVPKNDVSKAVDEVTVRCGISHFKKRLIRNLSGADKWSGSEPNRGNPPPDQRDRARTYRDPIYPHPDGSTSYMRSYLHD